MPPKKTNTVMNLLPEKVKIEYISGGAFIALKSASKLAGIHPAITEMGLTLLKKPNEGGIYVLGTPEMLNKANEIELLFRDGLRRIAKIFGPGGQAVKSYREENRLIFWYGIPKVKRKAA